MSKVSPPTALSLQIGLMKTFAMRTHRLGLGIPRKHKGRCQLGNLVGYNDDELRQAKVILQTFVGRLPAVSEIQSANNGTLCD